MLIYRKTIHSGKGIAALMFAVSMLAFAGMLLSRNPYVNAALLLIAKLSAACAVGVVWSIYIPELSGSGIVASANGVLESMGYALASVSSLAFSASIDWIGWGGLVGVWSGIMLIAGAVVTVSMRKKSVKNTTV